MCHSKTHLVIAQSHFERQMIRLLRCDRLIQDHRPARHRQEDQGQQIPAAETRVGRQDWLRDIMPPWKRARRGRLWKRGHVRPVRAYGRAESRYTDTGEKSTVSLRSRLVGKRVRLFFDAQNPGNGTGWS